MSSKNGAVLSTEIVREVLIIKENYEDWRIQLQTYLVAQGLWNNIIVDEPAGADINEEWERKNATALHAIHISCGPHAFSAIKHIPYAKQAWAILESVAEVPQHQTSHATAPNQESEITAEEVLEHEDLDSAIWNGNWHKINWIIRMKPDVVRERITFSRRTALHVAANTGNLSIVKMLVQNMSKEDLEITDKDGFTALAVAIARNATLDVAECMVQKNIEILGIKANNMLPVAMAFRYRHMEMGRYLYSITPIHYYLQTDPQDGKRIPSQDGATILCNAIFLQAFAANPSRAFYQTCHGHYLAHFVYHGSEISMRKLGASSVEDVGLDIDHRLANKEIKESS